MVERISSFQSWVGTIAAATLGVFSGYFINEILAEREQKWVFLVLLALFVVFFEKGLLYFLKRIIGNSVQLRRVIAAQHFIEGYWIEKLISSKNHNEIYGYAIVRIKFSDMEFVVSGEIVNKDLTDITANFTSNYTEYHNYTLVYYFEGTNVADDSHGIVGRADFQFVPHDKNPVRFRGEIVDTKNHDVLKIEGEKLSEELANKFSLTGSRELDTILLLKEHLK